MKRLVKAYIRRVTSAAGFEVKRLDSLQTAPSLSRGCISFIGLSGCGKSTLIHYLVAQRLIVRKRRSSAPAPNDTFVDDVRLDEAYVALMREGLRARVTPERARFLIDAIYKDWKLTRMSAAQCIVQDEGIFHHLPNEISNLSREDGAIVRQLARNRAIVYCFADPDIVANRIIRRRQDTGRVILQHRGKSDAAIRASLHDIADARLYMLEELDRCGIPFIKIDTGGEASNAASQFACFLRRLASHQPS